MYFASSQSSFSCNRITIIYLFYPIASWEWNPKSQLMTDLRLNDYVKFKDVQRAQQGLYNIVQSRSRTPVNL